jgi:hypothetical protein
MGKRMTVILGMALGLVWSVAVVWLPGQGPQPFIPINLALIYAFLPGGFFMVLMIGWIAAGRFFNDDRIDGAPPAFGSRADINQRVLTNTVEQMVLALLIWPFVSTVLGAVTVIVMGLAMGGARLLFWVGAHLSPSLRAFGFAASFYPTVLAGIWSLWRLAT